MKHLLRLWAQQRNVAVTIWKHLRSEYVTMIKILHQTELDGSIRVVDITELLNYYIADELQTVLCEVDDRINDCPLTLISSGTQDKIGLILAQGWSRSVALFTYCSFTSLFYWAVNSLSY
ncbi:hypothetical protein T07_3826 [Trichinella nelsoni]|uniref:Uncharacterized protein n=1 Tax=Trichinella nelsoni TaxID=6336 RepID=A0A0V0S784_9BILA|nr:hypothetical protein T07_3826 [Trichinella nelsoni]